MRSAWRGVGVSIVHYTLQEIGKLAIRNKNRCLGAVIRKLSNSTQFNTAPRNIEAFEFEIKIGR